MRRAEEGGSDRIYLGLKYFVVVQVLTSTNLAPQRYYGRKNETSTLYVT